MYNKTAEQLSPLAENGSPITNLVNAGKRLLTKTIASAQANAESVKAQALEENKILQRFASLKRTVESGLNDFKNFKDSCSSCVVPPESAADSVLLSILNRGAQFVNISDLSNLSSRLDHAKAVELLISSYERTVLVNNDRQLKEFISKHIEILRKHNLI